MKDIESSCCFTGYRPEKFNFPFETECEEYRVFCIRLSTAIADMIEKGCTRFFCGMALGFDIAAGERVAVFKKLNKSLRLIGVVPFSGQESKWPEEWKRRYNALLAECDEVITLNEGYAKWVFDQRNRYMVDRSRYVVTYFDGKQGGTDNTVKYALKNGREVLNIHETDPVGEDNYDNGPQYRLYPPEPKDLF